MELRDVELRRLSENLGSEWQKLATYLGFNRAKIQQYEIESERRGMENSIFDMLVSWRERQPKGTNFRAAMKSLLVKCDRVDLAETILSRTYVGKLCAEYSVQFQIIDFLMLSFGLAMVLAIDWPRINCSILFIRNR